MDSLLQNIQLVGELGSTAALILVIYGGWKEWWVFGPRYREKAIECEEERTRADEAEQKYVNILISDIEERKERDRTLELISKVAVDRKAN